MVALLLFVCLSGHQDNCRVIMLPGMYADDKQCQLAAPFASAGFLQRGEVCGDQGGDAPDLHGLAGISAQPVQGVMVLSSPEEDEDGTEGVSIFICMGPPECTRLDPPAQWMWICPTCKQVYIAPDGTEVIVSKAGNA